MSDVIIVLIIFGAFFGVFYLYFSTRHKERLSLIEKGADANLFYSAKKKKTLPWITLKIGMLFVGIAVGTAIGILITNSVSSMDFQLERLFIFSMIFLFGGISLIWNFMLERKLSKKDDEAE
ncbi:MAG: hypothetical protein HQ543_01600 [Bacteroidetes bacterium]|nr:hypothetical protein [Bacteroidota bacterium]